MVFNMIAFIQFRWLIGNCNASIVGKIHSKMNIGKGYGNFSDDINSKLLVVMNT